MAFKSISTKKMRSFLTMLGIIIGVAAVIILVSVVQGNNKKMMAFYESMGTNQIEIYAYSWNKPVADELYNYCLGLTDIIVGVTPQGQVWRSVNLQYGAKTMNDQESWESAPQLMMGNDQYALCNNYKIAQGRDLSNLDIKKYSQVCVIGANVAKKLFTMATPVGKEVLINGTPFTVVGVYEAKAYDEYSQQMDNLVLIPYVFNDTFNDGQPIEQYVVKAKDAASTTEATTRLTNFLSGLITNDTGYFRVGNNNTWIDQGNEAAIMQSLVLGSIAGISLLVGGIGIMNIMLVTVTERTREIGIRKAIGAERSSIIAQFLIEAAVICGIGGIIGIGIGYLGTLVAGKLMLQMILTPSSFISVGAFAFSVILGVIFGMYPAIKASGLQPVVALRAE